VIDMTNRADIHVRFVANVGIGGKAAKKERIVALRHTTTHSQYRRLYKKREK
jgi:hypothetical protein